MALFKAWCAGTETKARRRHSERTWKKMAAVQPLLRSRAKPSGRTMARLTRSLTMLPASDTTAPPKSEGTAASVEARGLR